MDGAELETEADPRLGQVINGTWRLIERIGTGGMATVYRAWDESLDREGALKVLETSLARDRVHRARFLREVRATRRIHHPNVVEVIDCGEDADVVYLVMALLRGRSLAEHLGHGPLDARDAVEIGAQIASGLWRAHQLQIVHRDIKPENVFLTFEGRATSRVKVLDFGLASVRGEARLTASGSVFGTPEYMSPEMTRGRPCTAASDLYSLGVILFEMLTGAPPFEGSMAELLVAHATFVPPALSTRRLGVDPDLETLVARLLAKNPDDRPAHAGQLVEQLGAIAARLPAESTRLGVVPVRARGDARPTVTQELWSERIESLKLAAARLPELPAGMVDAIDRLERAYELSRERAERLRQGARDLVAREAEAEKARDAIVAELERVTEESRVCARAMERSRTALAEASAAEDQALAGLMRSFGTASESDATAVAGRSAAQWKKLRSVKEALVKEATSLRQTAAGLARRRQGLQSELDVMEGRAEAEHRERREALAGDGARLEEGWRELALLVKAVVTLLPDESTRRSLLPTMVEHEQSSGGGN